MNVDSSGKIVLFPALSSKVEDLKRQGKKVVLSHGIFDLIHPGIISHLSEAKKQGDILVVTVIKDKDVRRGPGRPVFNENLRALNVSSLNYVDYVCIVDDENPFDCVKILKPHIFAKGQAYKDRDRQIHKRIFDEEREIYFGKSQIYETSGFSFSSSEIINRFTEIYPPETKAFLRGFADKYSFNDILDRINSLKDLNVLLIGDGIIDEYHYCTSMGKSAKAYLIVNKYITHEVFAGGVFAIANHLSSICENIKLVTLLGNQDSRQEFIEGSLSPNVESVFFHRDDSSTIIKKRYINQYLNQKLFEVNYINDEYISGEIEDAVIDYLKAEIPKHNLVLVSDFGHGFITKRIMDCIESLSPKLAINTQTNGANAGYNFITKYSKPNYVCLDEPEVRLAVQDKYGCIEDVARKVATMLGTESLIVTLGKRGSIGVNNNNDINRTPIFSSTVVDTVGAGDAFFAYTAPCFAKRMPLDFVSFIGNAVGALAVQIVGNKKAVEKHELLEFIHAILK